MYCTQTIAGKAKIQLQVTEENIEVMKKLQAFSCTKFAVGDYIALTEDGDYLMIDKDLKSKYSHYSKRFVYKIVDNQIIIRESNPPKLKFLEILTAEEIKTAKLFNPKASKGMFVIRKLHHTEVVTKDVFESDFTIL